MNQINCEDALITLLAELDGEETNLSSKQANAHLAVCDDCRQEFEQMQNTFNLLQKQTRREQDVDLWFEIENRIGKQPETVPKQNRKMLLFFGMCLVAYKLLEMIPDRAPGLVLRLIPFVLIVALFVFLRENPFKINTELIMEK
jgi:predicted anti-sigma-YlaC factor YlaD